MGLLAAAGCAASDEDTGTDQGHLETDAPSAKFPAFPYSLPQLTKRDGGPVLATPKFVAVTFDGDPMRDDVESFVSHLAGSQYWKTVGADYGVTGAVAADPVHIATAAPATIESMDIESWLASSFDGTHPEFGTLDPNAIYTVFYPPGTEVAQGGGVSCKDFGAFHGEFQVADTSYAYAAIPRCESYGSTRTSIVKGADFVTFSASHELLEAATDPFQSNPAYSDVDDAHVIWSTVFLNEVGDLCARGQQWTSATNDVGYPVQRMWSNSAAKAGHEPCIPAVEKTYFNAVPVLPEKATDMQLAMGDDPPPPPDPDDKDSPPAEPDTSTPMDVLRLAVGESKTIDVRLSSEGPTSGPWKVSAMDWDNRRGPDEARLTLAFDKTSGKNGDVLKLTITGKVPGPHPFVLVSTLGAASTYWPGMVLVH